jgi:hypothetical protein
MPAEPEILYRVLQRIPQFPGSEPGDHVMWRPTRSHGSLILVRCVDPAVTRLLSSHPEAFELVRTSVHPHCRPSAPDEERQSDPPGHLRLV